MSPETDSFGKARIIFEQALNKFVGSERCGDTKAIFDFALKLTRKMLDRCPAFGAGQVSLQFCDVLAREANGEQLLKTMIVHAGETGIVSSVNTESIRYTATVCLKEYIEQKLKEKVS